MYGFIVAGFDFVKSHLVKIIFDLVPMWGFFFSSHIVTKIRNPRRFCCLISVLRYWRSRAPIWADPATDVYMGTPPRTESWQPAGLRINTDGGNTRNGKTYKGTNCGLQPLWLIQTCPPDSRFAGWSRPSRESAFKQSAFSWPWRHERLQIKHTFMFSHTREKHNKQALKWFCCCVFAHACPHWTWTPRAAGAHPRCASLGTLVSSWRKVPQVVDGKDKTKRWFLPVLTEERWKHQQMHFMTLVPFLRTKQSWSKSSNYTH